MTPSPLVATPRPGPTSAGRLLAALVLVTGVATAPPTPPSLGAASGVVLGVVLWSRPPLRGVRTVATAAILIVASVLPIAVAAGPARAALVAGRALLAVTTAVAMLSAVPDREVAPALQALGVPATVAAVVAATLRQTTVLRTEGRRLLLARSLRGRSGARDGAALLGTLLARAAARAERIELSVRLRGYSPDRAMRRARLSWLDVPLSAAALTAAVLVHVLGRLP